MPFRTYRPEDFPGNELILSYTVAPTDNISGDWIDFGSTSLVSVTWNIQGLTGAEYVTLFLRCLPSYRGSDVPAATPDQGVADGTFLITSPPISVDVTISASETERQQLYVTPRWCYPILDADPTNTNTASVVATIVV